ncbi:MAG: SGNH/GDSL hydrolase family protein [Planctomycetaceae bacterium]|jgi:lysophospholipase L1-like esterase|nr:SGNH/GDSL hydrolase family protein [Planctomycetaceae bacterium]
MTKMKILPKPDVWRKSRRLLGILCLMTAALLTVLFYVKMKFARPLGSGPAGPAVASAPFETVWSERRVLLLGIGDSVTAGFGVNAPYNYVNRLADNPPDEFADMQGKCLRRVFPRLEVRNISVSGSTSLQHEKHIAESLDTQPDDVFGIVVMTSGGNDIIHNYGQSPPKEGAMYGATRKQAEPWIENYRQRLDRMIAVVSGKFPGGCSIYLADIYDPTDGVGDAPSVFLPRWPDCMKILDAYNAVIRDCAAKHGNVIPVPMHEVFLGHGIHCAEFYRKHYHREDPAYWFHSNLEDPNIRGYDAIRRVFLNEIIKREFPKSNIGSDRSRGAGRPLYKIFSRIFPKSDNPA